MRKSIIYFILILLFAQACQEKSKIKEKVVKAIYRDIQTKEDIQPITDSLVEPVIYTKVISLNNLPVSEKKRKFIELLLPAILVTQYNLNKDLDRVEQIEMHSELYTILNPSDSLFLEDLYQRYRTENLQKIKEKLQPHPASIVLGQAALESGWGTSRFFRDANNIFGIWSYNKNEDRIKALTTRDSVNIYLKKYPSIEGSIRDYYGTIARVRAYSDFRKKRLETQNPYELIPHLDHYSELGKAYTRTLSYLIKHNNLTQFDRFKIDPSYFEDRTILMEQ
ncbi:MAG: glucosaminidase domain-containing protein [Marinifilaceae bacterium]